MSMSHINVTNFERYSFVKDKTNWKGVRVGKQRNTGD